MTAFISLVYSTPVTGVHPCSCKSQSLPAPDTHLTNTDGRALCHTCMTRWVARGGVGNTLDAFPTYIYGKQDHLYIRSPNNMFLKRTWLCLHPIQTNLEASEGLPVKTRRKADIKLNVVMSCQIVPKRSTAPSSGRFQRRPAPPLLC